MQRTAPVLSGRGSERRARAAAACGSVTALVLGTAACVSQEATGWTCSSAGRGLGLVASLGHADAGSRDAGTVGEDAGREPVDAPTEGGCVDSSICPKGTVLFRATYSAPCADKTIVCRRLRPGPPPGPRGPVDRDGVWGDSVWLSGDLTREDVDAIVATVATVDAQPPHAIRLRDDIAEVTMECVGACIIGGSWGYTLRKINGAWTIVKQLPRQIE